jgi:hypothetical protein
VAGELEAMLAAFAASGAHVVTFTFPDVARIIPIARPLRPRVLDFNERVRVVARRHGALLVDAFPHPVTTDPRLWSADRIHATPLGHALIAAAAAHTLAVPGSDESWTEPLPALPPVPALRRARAELGWAAGFMGPWLVRRLRGRSSGDGRTAKRPDLRPVQRTSG